MISKNIEEYIQTFLDEVQIKLQKIPELIQKNALQTVKVIIYQIPTFKLNSKIWCILLATKTILAFTLTRIV